MSRLTSPINDKIVVMPRLGMRRESCVVCSMPVFLAEKLVISRMTYHRTCFKCARCQNILTPCSYYETEEGQYVCETCPDEDTSIKHDTYDDSLALNTDEDVEDVQACKRSLSDEEKCVQQQLNEARNPDVIKSHNTQITHMRLNFMSSHLQSADDEKLNSDFLHTSTESISKTDSLNPCNNDKTSPDVAAAMLQHEKTSKLHSMTMRTDNTDNDDLNNDDDDDNANKNQFVNKNLDDSTDSIHNRCLTATSHKIDFKDEFNKSQDTKEMLGVACDEADVNQCLSLVKKRLKLFENLVVNNDNDDDGNDDNKDCNNDNLQNLTTFMEPDSLEGDPETLKKNVVSQEHVENESKFDNNNLNAKGIDFNASKGDDNYPEDLNPFKSDDDGDKDIHDGNEHENCKKQEVKMKSTNPFDSSDDDNDEDNGGGGDDGGKNKDLDTPKPAVRMNLNNKINSTDSPQKRVLKAPLINLNPFWSDDEEPESDEENEDQSNEVSLQIPVPKPRKTRINESPNTNLINQINISSLRRDEIYASNSSLASSTSTSTHSSHYRKRKPAPPPPISNEKSSALINTPDVKTKPNAQSSPLRTPKPRKTKPAPPPPIDFNASLTVTDTSIDLENLSLSETSTNTSASQTNKSNKMDESWEDVKISKNEANRSKQSMSVLSRTSCDSHEYLFHDKSTQGKWKRKKAPAPAIPIPQRRKIKVLSMKDVKRELSEIEMQQQGLERQGVRLEQLIRDKCESGGGQDDESSLSMDADELVLELFALVNEKNELFRRQAELMLLKRQQRLEEEHADIEYQIRCLMCQPEATKTDFDKQREEALIQRLVEIVERRSEIVECLEMDRRREVEEDKSINMHMELYTAKNKGGNKSSDTEDQCRVTSKCKKTTKFKEKIKEKHFKKSHKKDADKDVDETEVKLKRQNKRKWF